MAFANMCSCLIPTIDAKRTKVVLADTQEWRLMADMHSVVWPPWNCWEEQIFSMSIPLWYVVEPILGFCISVWPQTPFHLFRLCDLEMERKQANVT